MMSIAYSFLLFYLEFDEHGITAKIESDCRESRYILTSFTAGHLMSFWALIPISGDDLTVKC